MAPRSTVLALLASSACGGAADRRPNVLGYTDGADGLER